MNSPWGQNPTLSIKSLVRNATAFQFIIPGSAILCILGIQLSKWFSDNENGNSDLEGSTLLPGPKQNYFKSEVQHGDTALGFRVLAEPIILWCYCFVLLMHIGFALLLCNGIAKRSFSKLLIWIIGELFLSLAGIAFCVFLTNLNIGSCLFSIIVVTTTIKTVVSLYSIIVVIIFMNTNQLTKNSEGSVRWQKRRCSKSRAQSCTDNLNKSTQTLGSTN